MDYPDQYTRSYRVMGSPYHLAMTCILKTPRIIMCEPKREKRRPLQTPIRTMMDEKEHRRRAIAHLKSAVRYERKGLHAKARAHFGRAMHYGSEFDLGKLPREIIEMIVMRVINDGEGHSLVEVRPFMKAVTVEVNVSEFLRMSVDDMLRSSLYQLYITVVHAMARKSTLEMVEFLSKYEKSVTIGDTSRDMESVIRHLRVLIMLEWFHMCPYRFHDLVALLHAEGTPDGIKATCKRLLDAFTSHLGSTEECGECKILKRPEIKREIQEIITKALGFHAIEVDHDGKVVEGFVEKYESDLANKRAKYGHLCVWKTGMVRDMTLIFDSVQWRDEEWDVRLWDTRIVTTMSYAFWNCKGLLSGVECWSVSEVRNMSNMFNRASSFNRGISIWDTRKVVDMSWMFAEANSFNRDIGNWDTSKVIRMGSMFLGVSMFNMDIGKWDTSKVLSMNSMFRGAGSFNQPIGEWKTGLVHDMGSMFSRAGSFNQNIGKWNTSNVRNMNGMFYEATAFNQDIGQWNTSEVTDMGIMFHSATAFNQDISGWDMRKVDTTYLDTMFDGATAMEHKNKPPVTIQP